MSSFPLQISNKIIVQFPMIDEDAQNLILPTTLSYQIFTGFCVISLFYHRPSVISYSLPIFRITDMTPTTKHVTMTSIVLRQHHGRST